MYSKYNAHIYIYIYTAIWECATGNRAQFIKYFTKETHGILQRTVWEKPRGAKQPKASPKQSEVNFHGAPSKVFINFVLFPVAIFTYNLYGILVT